MRWNSYRRRSSEQNVLDEAFPDEVGAVEIYADDDAGDEDDDDALDQLALSGPLDFLQLAPRLGDEVLEPPARDRARLAGGFGLSAGARRRSARRRGRSNRQRGLTAGRHLLAPGAALRTCLSSHYRVSRCGVCRPPQRQYFLNSIRSGEFRFDFCV